MLNLSPAAMEQLIVGLAITGTAAVCGQAAIMWRATALLRQRQDFHEGLVGHPKMVELVARCEQQQMRTADLLDRVSERQERMDTWTLENVGDHAQRIAGLEAVAEFRKAEGCG